MKEMTWDDLIALWCARVRGPEPSKKKALEDFKKLQQELSPENLARKLRDQIANFQPTGFMLLECQMLDSSAMGSLTILPFGPNNTFKEPPTRPISPRGMAMDMSMVIGWIKADTVPKETV